MRVIKRVLPLLLALLLLLPLAPAARAEDGIPHEEDFAGKTWEEIVDEFLAEHHTVPETVAFGWCNTVTGEERYHNGDQYMVSGSMYKVPMNMIFTEKVHNGEIGWDSFIGGYRYEYCLHATIVDSNNEVAKGMWDYLGGYQPYRHILAPYMGEDPDTVDPKFYENNFSTPRQMIYSLKLLATESERFPRLIDEMLQAEPNKYFRERPHDYDIAQKYGYWPDPNSWHVSLNDCAILFTEEPVCIVIFIDSSNEQASRELLKDYCDLMIAYTEYSTAARKEAERIAAEQAAIAALNAATPAPEATEEPAQPAPTAGSGVSLPADTPAPAAVKKGPSLFSGVILPLLLALAVAVGALYFLGRALRRARRGKLNLPWALAAVLLAAAALWLCILPQRETAPAASVLPAASSAADLEEARETVSDFFDALKAGDWPEVNRRLSGVSTLGLENAPESADAAALYDALRGSWDYSLYGECRESAGGAMQQVVFYTLDFDALRAAVKEQTEEKVERLAAELDPDEIYAEDGAYLDSFTRRAYDEALAGVLAHSGQYSGAVGLNVRLVERGGEWLIVPDDALYGALTGGAVSGKGA